MQVQVNISQEQGAPIASTPKVGEVPVYQTNVFEQAAKDADARIAQIINANLATAAASTKAK